MGILNWLFGSKKKLEVEKRKPKDNLRFKVSVEDHDCNSMHPDYSHSEWQNLPDVDKPLKPKSSFFTNKRIPKSNAQVEKKNSDNLSKDQKMLAFMYKTLKGVDYSGVRFDASGSTPEEFLASDIDGSWYYSQSQIVMIFKAFSNEIFQDALQGLLNANKIKLDDETPIPGRIRSWNGNGFKIENPPQLNGANLIMITNTELTVKKD